MARPGQKNVYQDKVLPRLKEIAEWYRTMTQEEIADCLGISRKTLSLYKRQHPELAAALDIKPDEMVTILRDSMKSSAVGYYWEEVQTTTTYDADGLVTGRTEKRIRRHVPPNLGAQHLLLKNLDPTWHDADNTTILQREKELEIKQQKADAAEW